mgnify:CR=1 FL=1
MRKSNQELRTAVNWFFREHYRGLKFNTIYSRYFRD